MAETQFEERPQEFHSKYFIDSRTPFSADTLKHSKFHDLKLPNFAEKPKALPLKAIITFKKPEDTMAKVEDTTIPDVESILLDPMVDEIVVMNHDKLTEEEKRTKLQRTFSSACSNGNLEKVLSMLKNVRAYIDVDAQDEDGITPLIYAACFGHEKVAWALLEAGAKVDSQDKSKLHPHCPNVFLCEKLVYIESVYTGYQSLV
jgi:hypothetical protein